jgi:hypothetical protein
MSERKMATVRRIDEIRPIKAADQVEQRGLKAVIEQIWFGPNNKCL